MKVSVFLVDDHAVVRDGLKLLLESYAGISVVGEASDGRTAVHCVRDLRPDVVVMDITMPEMDGVEATRQIREECPTAQVIILSMHSTSEHVFRALEAGARGYLVKESAGVEVVDAVIAVKEGRRYLSRKISEQVLDDYVKHRPGPSRSPLELLSSREREVLQLVVEGKTSAEIGEILFISAKTVETYRSRLMQKLGTSDIPSLVKFAIQHGLTAF
jgi:DNA-binding NarL/FixJ family response regulator